MKLSGIEGRNNVTDMVGFVIGIHEADMSIEYFWLEFCPRGMYVTTIRDIMDRVCIRKSLFVNDLARDKFWWLVMV